MIKMFHTIEKNKIDKMMKSSYMINKNEIKRNVTLFLISDNLKRLHNAIVR